MTMPSLMATAQGFQNLPVGCVPALLGVWALAWILEFYLRTSFAVARNRQQPAAAGSAHATGSEVVQLLPVTG